MVGMTGKRNTCVRWVVLLCQLSAWVMAVPGLSGQEAEVHPATEFTCLKPGSFRMGSRDGDRDERPVHEVTLTRGFCIGTYEVTQDQWEAVMGTSVADQLQRSRAEGQGRPNWDLRGSGPLHPMYLVSWNETQDFLARLNESDPAHQYRLPTEAEWEYAARAGSSTDYGFGNDTTELARFGWYTENSDYLTQPVGQLEPNAWGLFDMHGNVWEWVQDGCRDYRSRSVVDPVGSDDEPERSMRGGSWGNPARSQRSAHRTCNAVGSRSRGLGLRLVN